MVSMLERGERRPSVSTARSLIRALALTGERADAIRAIAVPCVGRDSPFRTGIEPDS
jgi:hypothetical protein